MPLADLQKVLDVLRDAGFSSAFWKPLGRRLKSGLDLDAIEHNHPRNVKHCLEEVISFWQRDGDVSWEKMAQAVAQCKGWWEECSSENTTIGMYILSYTIVHW